MSREDYEIVIGLEVHCELSTKTKIFCSCSTEFGGEPNTHCCPICMAMPGTLPVLNEKVVEYAVKAGLATNCSIEKKSKNDRKNYFYPDLPKAYQISQFDMPLCYEGAITIETEEDAFVNGIVKFSGFKYEAGDFYDLTPPDYLITLEQILKHKEFALDGCKVVPDGFRKFTVTIAPNCDCDNIQIGFTKLIETKTYGKVGGRGGGTLRIDFK